MQKRGLVTIFTALLLFSVAGVIAEDNISIDGGCDSYCNDFWMSATPGCPGEQATSGVFPDCECGWECYEKEDEFGEGDNYRCEDMSEKDCENVENCESVLGSSFCEGDMCTDDMIWKGCMYRYEKTFKELEGEYEDEKVNPGITPDSMFYFLDGIFGDSREEKIAEVEAMIEKEDYKSARKALLKYMKQAKKFEDDPNPEKRDEARKSAAAIHRMLEKIKDIIPEGEREEFYDNIRDTEGSIITSVEIASKIKELCTQLSELDPIEYSRMCKTDDDAPEWQKRLDRDLSAEQEKVAKKFIDIMKDCFKTSGQDCRCEEIPFPDFADACSEAAPLATACDVDGDERACDKLDDLDMPDLPEWLQPIWEELEGGMNEAQFDMHMPRECVDAGVTDPKECGRVMIETNSPEECKEALLAANVQNEREGREICDKIMMEIHAPECVEQGITDPKNCKEFYKEQGFEGPRDERGPMIDFDCKGIEDPMERLDCFDKASSQTKGSYGGFDENYKGNCMTDADWKAKKQECREKYGEHAGDEPIYGDSGDGYECTVDARCIDFSQGKLSFDDIKEKEKECANDCDAKGGRWDFSYGDCKCYFDDHEDYERREFEGDERRDDYKGEVKCDDCASGCEDRPGQRLRGTDCVNDRCECYYESDSPQYSEEEGPGEPSVEETVEEPAYQEEEVVIEESPAEEESSSMDVDNTESFITGEVVSNVEEGNVFLDYWFA